MPEQQLEPGSFRDRTARVLYHRGAVFRGLNDQALEEWEALSSTEFFRRFVEEGKLVRTERVGSEGSAAPLQGDWSAILKHQTIPFISYPYEWCFGMLKDAALLQLELLLAALNEEMILKDSSAFNFQWQGATPVFIDIPSFQRLLPGDPWVGYRQFCQMFLYPLLLQAYKDVPFQPWLRGNLEGIEPDDCRRLMSTRDYFRPGFFKHVVLQSRAQAKFADTGRDIKADLRGAGFSKGLIVTNVRGLEKVIRKLVWKRTSSTWSDYTRCGHYEPGDREKKRTFVRDVVMSRRWNLVWDLGCNTGAYSRIASENADHVVALDADQLAAERFYQELKTEGNATILPLVSDLADPSPNLGWRGLERKPLTERGRPDLVLCLALIHHIVIGSNIRLEEFVEWLSSLGGDLIIEFVTKQDSMVQTLLINKEDNYDDYDKDHFERCLSSRFAVVRQETLLSGTRVLYHARTPGRSR